MGVTPNGGALLDESPEIIATLIELAAERNEATT